MLKLAQRRAPYAQTQHTQADAVQRETELPTNKCKEVCHDMSSSIFNTSRRTSATVRSPLIEGKTWVVFLGGGGGGWKKRASAVRAVTADGASVLRSSIPGKVLVGVPFRFCPCQLAVVIRLRRGWASSLFSASLWTPLWSAQCWHLCRRMNAAGTGRRRAWSHVFMTYGWKS